MTFSKPSNLNICSWT